MVYIYVLQLEKGKYYIGKTNNPQFRLENHFNSNGSEWTKLYKPLRAIELNQNCDDYDEDKITMKYMDKYGIDNVRGGSFVSVKLQKSEIDILKKMSNGTNNNCFICGTKGHFAKNCESYQVFVCEYCGKEFTENKKCEYHEKKCDKNNEKCNCPTSYFSSHRIKCFLNNEILNDEKCFRCGREGHYASSCYASKHIKGYYL